MFTGIIRHVGTVQTVKGQSGGKRLGIDLGPLAGDLAPGASVAVNGACLTAAAVASPRAQFDAVAETLNCTTLGDLRVGAKVNLERPLCAGDAIDGHLVQGHVDGVGRIEAVRKLDEFAVWRFNAPPEVARYLVPKGSVTIDGISLTVVDPTAEAFEVAIIPETLKKTKLSSKGPGDPVNMEADMLGKHIFHYMHGAASVPLTQDFLTRHGIA